MQLLLDKGADVNLQGELLYSEVRSFLYPVIQGVEFGTALQAAAYQKNSKIIELLLNQRADINLQGNIGIHIGGYAHVSL